MLDVQGAQIYVQPSSEADATYTPSYLDVTMLFLMVKHKGSKKYPKEWSKENDVPT